MGWTVGSGEATKFARSGGIALGATLYVGLVLCCLLYTSDAADERSSVDLGGRRIIKKKKNKHTRFRANIDTKSHECYHRLPVSNNSIEQPKSKER